MKLVFIYGPPASGKLTVARELSKLTGFKLFDNHVSIRFVESLFDFGTRPFLRLTGKYRMEMIETAAKEGIDTIFTFVYGKTVDDPFVREIKRKVSRHGGKVCFVRLQSSLTIDTTNQSPGKAARIIARRFGFRALKKR